MYEHMNGYGWSWGGMGLGMLLFWVLLIVGIVMLVRSCSSSGAKNKDEREKTALDLLKERYARGEIGQEEFLQKKHDLED